MFLIGLFRVKLDTQALNGMFGTLCELNKFSSLSMTILLDMRKINPIEKLTLF